jgi:hypothetical protein
VLASVRLLRVPPAIRRRTVGSPLARRFPKGEGHAIDLERIAINHTGRLREGGRGSEHKGSSQGGQFNRTWLTCDCGDNAATAFVVQHVGSVVWHIIRCNHS